MRKLLLILMTVFIAGGLHANDATKIQSQIDATTDKLQANNRDALRTRKHLAETASMISDIEDQKASIADKITALESKRTALAAQIKESNAGLSDATGAMIAISNTGTSFDEKNTENYVLTSSILGSVSEQFDADMNTAWQEIKELDKLQKELEKAQGNYTKVSERHKKELAQLEDLLRDRDKQNEQLRGKQSELKQRLNVLSAKSKNLVELTDQVATPRSYGAWSSSRKLRFPASGMMLLRFGDKNSMGLVSSGWKVRTRSGALVVAPADGKIEFADYFKGYNNIVIINHNNGYYSVLTGMGNLNVLIGQEVLGGEPIGRMPDSSPEIYMELRYGTKPIDPARMFMEPR